MTSKQHKSISDFVKDTKQLGSDMALSGVSDRKLALKFRCLHIRAGKFSKNWGSNKEFHGTPILAVAHSSIDDVAQILTMDGRTLSV